MTIAEITYRTPQWNAQLNRWWMRIGVTHTKQGALTKKAFYWSAPFNDGKCPAEITADAVDKQKEWERIVSVWPQIRLGMRTIWPGDMSECPDYSKPAWVDLATVIPQIEAKEKENRQLVKAFKEEVFAEDQAAFLKSARQQVEAKPLAQHELIQQMLAAGLLPQTVANSVARQTMTIDQAIAEFLAEEAKRVGVRSNKGLKAGTYNGKRNNLLISVGKSTHVEGRGKGRALRTDRQPIDTSIVLPTLTKQHLTDFVNYWLGESSGVAVRTAVNYAKAFKSFLDWCDSKEGYGFSLPKGTDDLFTFRNIKGGKINEFNAIEMATLLHAAGEKTRLYILLMLNCGYYGSDIGDLRFEDLSKQDGEPCLWRQRTKTSHQNEFESLHYLWPETHELLQRHVAPRANPHGRLLLTKTGEPLYRESVGGFKNAAITRAIENASDTAKVKIQPKQFRKFGATAVLRISGNSDVARLYAGQVIPGSLKHYAREDFAPLTKALKTWGEELRAASVFPTATG